MEADFQEYYGLDIYELVERDPQKAARLFGMLGPLSRTIMALNPAKDWTWDREVQSRILAKLDIISCQVANLFRKKGKSALKPDKQYQPDYVEDAKKQAEEIRKEKKKFDEKEMNQIKQFWKARNPKVRFFDE